MQTKEQWDGKYHEEFMERHFPQEAITREPKSLLIFLEFLEKSGWKKKKSNLMQKSNTGLGGKMLTKATSTRA